MEITAICTDNITAKQIRKIFVSRKDYFLAIQRISYSLFHCARKFLILSAIRQEYRRVAVIN